MKRSSKFISMLLSMTLSSLCTLSVSAYSKLSIVRAESMQFSGKKCRRNTNAIALLGKKKLDKKDKRNVDAILLQDINGNDIEVNPTKEYGLRGGAVLFGDYKATNKSVDYAPNLQPREINSESFINFLTNSSVDIKYVKSLINQELSKEDEDYRNQLKDQLNQLDYMLDLYKDLLNKSKIYAMVNEDGKCSWIKIMLNEDNKNKEKSSIFVGLYNLLVKEDKGILLTVHIK